MEEPKRPLAAAGAPAGRTPAPRPARGILPRLRGPRARMLKGVGVVLLILTDQATAASVHSQPAALQRRNQSPSEGLCLPGFHLSEQSGLCEPCTDGVDFMNHSNSQPSCFRCTACKNDQEEKSACTATRNTVCQCRSGTYWDKDSTEMCQKCTECADGEVEQSPCTPWSDRKCVVAESSTKPGGEALAPGEPVTTHLGAPACPHPSSVSGLLVAIMVLVLLLIMVVLVAVWKTGAWKRIYHRMKSLSRGHGPDSGCVDAVCLSHPVRGPEVQDNDNNEALSSRQSLSVQQEMDRQEPVTGTSQQSPEEAEHLLGSAKAQGSPVRRRVLVPADGNDPIEALKEVFNYCVDIVPYPSWDKLMRQMGLTDNEIHRVRARTHNQDDALYEMLLKWLNKTGRSASINTLLDALETVGERYAREKIEEWVVASGKFVYREDAEGSTVSVE